MANGQGFSIDQEIITVKNLKHLCGIGADEMIAQLIDSRLQPLQEAQVVTLKDGAQFFTMASGSEKALIDMSIITSVLALTISLISLSYTYMSSRETSASDAVKSSYSIFLDMAKIEQQNSRIMHVFTLSNTYPSVVAKVKLATKDLTLAERSQLVLAERSLAEYIFTTFEYSLYEHKVAVDFHDNAKAQFLKEVLDYFTARLLRNPRLLYYWDKKGGGLSTLYEDWTNAYYDSHVLHDKQLPLLENPDASGPIQQN